MVLVARFVAMVVIGHNAMYLLAGFLCLFAVRYGEDEKEEEPAKVQSDRILYQGASLVCVLISTDNLLRWLERGGKPYWYWLCSGSMAMVVLEQSPWLCNLCIGQT